MTHIQHWGGEYGPLDEEVLGLSAPSDVWQELSNAIFWGPNVCEELPHEDTVMQLFDVAPRTTAPNTSSVNQCVNEWSGDFGFSAVIASSPKAGKNVNWTYSERLRKLYAVVNAPCPIRFVTERAPPEGSFVCAVAVFRESESRRENVLRCPAHRTPANALGAGSREDQWFHCDHPQAQNCCDEANGGRHCVRLPLGPEPFSLTFGCRNSCPGGLRRRATEVVFLLQSPEGQDLARSVVQVKVCACPGRDRRHDEQGEERERAALVARAALPSTSMHRDADCTDGSSSDSGGEGRGGTFLLRVKDRDVYKFLYHVHQSLEGTHAATTPSLRMRQTPSSESDD
ncbi:cellular tumor antigen p53-like isoform X2 [Dermacentor albipictus]|uniref:cellular tumor antigen p53-like isoform X2 n=1 Tax=Dermacentor albipictus TaxID=60249 RepID=UPI0031FCA0B5